MKTSIFSTAAQIVILSFKYQNIYMPCSGLIYSDDLFTQTFTYQLTF